MAILSISEASRRWRLGRSSLYRAIKSGRLNLSTQPDGTKGIDVAELVWVFGEPSQRTTANVSDLSSEPLQGWEADDREQARTPSPVNLLQAQVNQLTNQLEQSYAREARLLVMLETEQTTRRELEQRLLPPPEPRPAPILARPPISPWRIVALIVAALALGGWQWRDMIMRALNG